MGKAIDILSTLLCVGAGVYLLQYSSPGQNSWFEIIGHGMGIYFIGKGLFIARSTHLARESRDFLRLILEAVQPGDEPSVKDE